MKKLAPILGSALIAVGLTGVQWASGWNWQSWAWAVCAVCGAYLVGLRAGEWR